MSEQEVTEEGYRSIELCVSEHFGSEIHQRQRYVRTVAWTHAGLVVLLPMALVIGANYGVLKEMWAISGGLVTSAIGGSTSFYFWRAKVFAANWELSWRHLQTARTAWPAEYRRFVLDLFRDVMRRPLKKEPADGI